MQVSGAAPCYSKFENINIRKQNKLCIDRKEQKFILFIEWNSPFDKFEGMIALNLLLCNYYNTDVPLLKQLGSQSVLVPRHFYT